MHVEEVSAGASEGPAAALRSSAVVDSARSLPGMTLVSSHAELHSHVPLPLFC